MGAVMEAIPAQMQTDQHDAASTSEAQSAAEAIRMMITVCAEAEIDATAAASTFQVGHTNPVVIAELRQAYVATINVVAGIFDMASALEREHTKKAEELERLADMLEAEAAVCVDDEQASDAAGAATAARAEAQKERELAQKCARAAMAAHNALERLQLGHQGLDRCRGMEDAHGQLTRQGGPAQPTAAYAA